MRCLQKFHCTALEMSTEMWVGYSDIPADLLPMLTLGVSKNLDIRDCKLLGRGDDVECCDAANKTRTTSPTV